MKNRLGCVGVLAAVVVPVSWGNAVPTGTGFFAEVEAGSSYSRFNEHFRGKNEKKKDQIEIVKEKKNSFFVGLHVGYGYEMPCGFYVGGKIYGLYNSAEIKEDEKICGEWSSPITKWNTEYDYLRAKPQFSYGFSLMLGGKIVPNVLVYAQCGFESTYWKIKQLVVFTEPEFGETMVLANGVNTPVEQRKLPGGVWMKASPEDVGEIKRQVCSVVPGVGMKYFFNGGVYVGADFVVTIGFFRKVEEKNCCGVGTFHLSADASTWENSSMIQLNEQGDLYLGRNVSFRYGLTVGYKF